MSTNHLDFVLNTNLHEMWMKQYFLNIAMSSNIWDSNTSLNKSLYHTSFIFGSARFSAWDGSLFPQRCSDLSHSWNEWIMEIMANTFSLNSDKLFLTKNVSQFLNLVCFVNSCASRSTLFFSRCSSDVWTWTTQTSGVAGTLIFQHFIKLWSGNKLILRFLWE